MAVGKEIRTKISSVKNTQKITKAMEMVAASKMRRAQERMAAARPYANKIRNVIAHVAKAKTEYHHPFLEIRAPKNVGVVMVTTDRGLCGGLNANLFRLVLKTFEKWEKENINIKLVLIGNKGINFFSKIGGSVIGKLSQLGDSPSPDNLIGSVKIMIDSFIAEELDEVYLAYNNFVNRMTQGPKIEQLLPLRADASEEFDYHWDYIYEPEASEVIDVLFTRYIESLVYQAVVENIACEQAARMVAMNAASDNAGKLIEELELVYNKARQAAITQELSEIVGGASAV